MKAGRFFGLLFAATILTDPIHAADSTTTTNRSGGLSGVFEQLLKTALTNLTQTRTNIISNPTNIISLPSAITNSPSLNAIPLFELDAGVKEAIATGLARAVTTLGRTNGYFTNALAKIELPSQLASADKMLRALWPGPAR